MDADLARSTGQRAMEQVMTLEFELADRYPDAWRLADGIAEDLGGRTRPWCLLPIEAYCQVALEEGLSEDEAGEAALLLAAFHHWRYTRSVYMFSPVVWADIFRPDRPGPLARIEDFKFPEWCACFGVAGNTILTLLCPIWSDSTQESLLVVLSCADDLSNAVSDVLPLNGRDSVADVIAAPMHEVRTRMPLPEGIAMSEAKDREAVDDFALILARHLNPAVYLAGPGASITAADGASVRPRRSPKSLAAEDHRVWLVGYPDPC
jgi:hypothetical protein